MGTQTRTDDEQRARTRLADRWFHELDRRRIEFGDRRWVALVTGVHLTRREAWIQIADDGAPSASLVLHVYPWTTVAQAITAMQRRVDTGPFPRVVRAGPDSWRSAVMSS